MKSKDIKRDPSFEYSLYSDDDGVQIYETENDALKTKRAWIKSGANNVRGPFKSHRSRLDKAAPALLTACKKAYFALPTTAEAVDFIKTRHGNWGLTEDEMKIAKLLASAIAKAEA